MGSARIFPAELREPFASRGGYDCDAMEAMALIEIDGLPFAIKWWIFPWLCMAMLNNQMVNG